MTLIKTLPHTGATVTHRHTPHGSLERTLQAHGGSVLQFPTSVRLEHALRCHRPVYRCGDSPQHLRSYRDRVVATMDHRDIFVSVYGCLYVIPSHLIPSVHYTNPTLYCTPPPPLLTACAINNSPYPSSITVSACCLISTVNRTDSVRLYNIALYEFVSLYLDCAHHN